MENIDEVKFHHGGRPGMKKGQFILPPSVTGARSTAEFGNYQCDQSRVYVTTAYAAAALYAGGVRKGEIYEVMPIGELHQDPDCDKPGLSYSCEKAKILKRYRLTKAERKMVVSVLAV